MAIASVGELATSASIAAQHDRRLSSRPLARSDSSAPITAAGWVSYRHSSQKAGRSVPASLGDPAGEVTWLGRSDAPHRPEVLLRVELEPVGVDATVEVDGQLRDPGDRPADVDQRMGAVGHRQPTGDTEVPVEPRVVQDPAVHLDVQLLPAGLRLVGRVA